MLHFPLIFSQKGIVLTVLPFGFGPYVTLLTVEITTHQDRGLPHSFYVILCGFD